MLADHDDDYDEVPEDRFRPLDLDETIRAVICTSDTPEDLAGRVQQAIGEYAGASDELHVSHAVAPDPRSGLMLYTALIVLRPGRASGRAADRFSRQQPDSRSPQARCSPFCCRRSSAQASWPRDSINWSQLP